MKYGTLEYESSSVHLSLHQERFIAFIGRDRAAKMSQTDMTADTT